MRKDDADAWFLPKRLGYGAGLPIRWQGWALLIGYLALVFAMMPLLAARHPLVFGAIVAVATAAMTVVAAQHTRGGWRWRWGGEDDR